MTCCVAAISVFVSCEKDPVIHSDQNRAYQNLFAYTYMSQAYVWADEIKNELDSWKTSFYDDASKVDPIETVSRIRHKYDRWTLVTEDFDALVNSVQGISTTFGFILRFYISRTDGSVIAVVLCTYKDSPAEKVGLKRGDYITSVNGISLTTSNYESVYYNEINGGISCLFTVCDNITGEKREINLSPVEMYQEPVMLAKVFDVAGKKVGYLLYDSFTLESIDNLKLVMRSFAQAGVSELILDMRYNLGGYVTAEIALATMLAPKSVIGDEKGSGGAVYQKLVYNSLQSSKYKDEDMQYRFAQVLKDSNGNEYYNVSGLNLDLKKVYAIMTSNSASASEAILVGLAPYLDVEIIGQSKSEGSRYCSQGKFCQGTLNSAEDFIEYNRSVFEDDYDDALSALDNWGIYVMNARYTDCNGNCPIMPDGFAADILSVDNPLDGAALGDQEETMLKAALQCAAGSPATKCHQGARPLDDTFAPADFQPFSPSILVDFR